MTGYTRETTLLRRDLARITDRVQVILREAAKKDSKIKLLNKMLLDRDKEISRLEKKKKGGE